MIRAIGFDLDNTLFDHREAATRGVDLLVSEKKWNYQGKLGIGQEWHRLEDLYFAQYVAGVLTLTEHRRARMREFLSSTNARVEEKQLDALFNDYLIHYSNSWVAFADAHAVLSELKEVGYKFAVLTNGQQAQQEAKLKAMGLADLFEDVLAIGTVDALKPDPKAFIHLCRVLNCNPNEVLFVGDDLDYDVLPAIRSGLHGVWLNRNGLVAQAEGAAQVESLSELKEFLYSLNSERAVDEQ